MDPTTKMEPAETSITTATSYAEQFSRTFAEIATVSRKTRNRRGESIKKRYHINVSRVKTRICRTFSKLAVAEYRNGNRLPTRYQ